MTLAHFARAESPASNSMCSMTDRLQRSVSEKKGGVHVTHTKRTHEESVTDLTDVFNVSAR